MTINLQTGGYIPPQPQGARSADIQVEQKQLKQVTSIPAPAEGQTAPADAPSAEEKRYERVAQAAQNFFQNSYAVSDKSFSIFKDSSGQYITRYTSLRDGRVTYIPELRLLQAFENSQSSGQSVVQIQA